MFHFSQKNSTSTTIPTVPPARNQVFQAQEPRGTVYSQTTAETHDHYDAALSLGSDGG